MRRFLRASKENVDLSDERVSTIQQTVKGSRKFSINSKRPRSRRATRRRRSTETVDAEVVTADDIKKNAAVFLEKIRSKGLRGQREDFRAERHYLPEGSRKAWSTNEFKNRYADVQCLDATRVVLKNCETDYIHANRVLAGSVHYICSQGPLPSTIPHFWSMIWQENVSLIVMLCNFVENNDEKSAEYYSQIKDRPIYISGDFRITCIDVSPLEGFERITYHKFEVAHKGESRLMNHYQYDGWPDHGAPDNTSNCIQFVKKIRRHPRERRDAPIVVHCSAGVGRTGSFVGIQLAIACLRKPDFSIVNVFKKMRDQRMHAIQTEQQYTFLVCAVLDYLNERQIFDDANLSKFLMAYEGFVSRKKKKSLSSKRKDKGKSKSNETDDP